MFYRHISFGWGLGDIFGYFILFGGTFLHIIGTLYLLKNGNTSYSLLSLIFLFFSVYITLKATLWRGSEYGWNGSLFYLACPQKIHIFNANKEKELLVRMCTGEYSSEFKAVWKGDKMVLTNGELQIQNAQNGDAGAYMGATIFSVDKLETKIVHLTSRNKAAKFMLEKQL